MEEGLVQVNEIECRREWCLFSHPSYKGALGILGQPCDEEVKSLSARKASQGLQGSHIPLLSTFTALSDLCLLLSSVPHALTYPPLAHPLPLS